MHEEVPALNEAGVTVKYALYARMGNGTVTSRQLSEVLCSADPKAQVDRFFANPSEEVPQAQCDAAQGLERIAQAANQVGLKATPHIITGTGFAASGYMRAPELLRLLGGGA